MTTRDLRLHGDDRFCDERVTTARDYYFRGNDKFFG